MADPYLTPTEIRSRVGSGAGSLPPTGEAGDALIAEWVAEFEEIAEDYRGVAFTPREFTLSVYARESDTTVLLPPQVLSVASVTVAGTEVAADAWNVSTVDGILEYPGGVGATQTIVVVGEHGFPAPPQRLKRACLQYVVALAQQENAGTSRDIISQSYDGGFTRYSTPSKAEGRPTGFLEVDRLLNSLPDYRIPGAA